MKITKIESGLWELFDGLCRSYLITGTKRALLWDTGNGSCNVKSAVESLTDMPYDVVLSHGHWDHLGGILQFNSIWINPKDEEIAFTNYRDKFGVSPQGKVGLRYLEEGQKFELGERTLEILFIPGHSSGCVALLNKNEGYALTGDMFLEKAIMLFSPTSDFDIYCDSLGVMLKCAPGIDRVYPAHDEMLPIGHLEKLKAAVEQYKESQELTENYHLQIPGRDIWIKKFTYAGIEILLKGKKDDNP